MLEVKSSYCKVCDDKFWNSNDCKSIKEKGACVFCIKEKKVKKNSNKK